MEAVILSLGDGESTSWDVTKKMMRKPDFLSKMLDYDPNTNILPTKIIEKLNAYVNNP